MMALGLVAMPPTVPRFEDVEIRERIGRARCVFGDFELRSFERGKSRTPHVLIHGDRLRPRVVRELVESTFEFSGLEPCLRAALLDAFEEELFEKSSKM
jgi:hypothetical protein